VYPHPPTLRGCTEIEIYFNLTRKTNMLSITNSADISGKRKFMFADFKLEEDHGVTILKVYMDEDKKWNKLSKEKQNAVREFLEQHADELKPKHNAAVVLTFRDCGTEVHITFKQKQ
jgi:TRAP-type C4-dicarboxylate transport system substrate-binding protein